jgi:hypothetical protein
VAWQLATFERIITNFSYQHVDRIAPDKRGGLNRSMQHFPKVLWYPVSKVSVTGLLGDSVGSVIDKPNGYKMDKLCDQLSRYNTLLLTLGARFGSLPQYHPANLVPYRRGVAVRLRAKGECQRAAV